MLRRSSGKIRRSTPPGDAALTLRKGVYPEVVERDGGKCQMCGRAGQEVHEIIPRSRWSSRTVAAAFELRNMVCLCRMCHAKAASRQQRMAMLVRLTQLHGYDYSDKPWSEYFTSEIE
jgi:5-methylcytosine-specific restriction endonuclease McrA